MSSIKDNEYRQQADYCERMAHRAVTADLKASWLDLAQKWLSLIRKPALLQIVAVRRGSNWAPKDIGFPRNR
jgi:hypothetical protein